MQRSLSGKLADVSNIEKKTCGELTDIKETVLHMCAEVDRVTDEQVLVYNAFSYYVILQQICAKLINFISIMNK